jgi:single-stranded-DNA-specific exonuclease
MLDAPPARTILERSRGDAEPALRQRLSPLLARVLAARGVTGDVDLDLSLAGLAPPTLLLGADRAAAFLADAVAADRHIVVVGDFDADGATASALAVAALSAFGAQHVSFLVPNRFEYGYGLTPEIVAQARTLTPDVIVTVDNGISSCAGVAAARAAGIDVVITDHHLPGAEVPAANVVVNPNQAGCTFPSKALAGVGVIFYVMTLLRAELRARSWFQTRKLDEPNMAQFLDLVALGTVADVVPLDRNNRILVAQGLRRMRAGQMRPGIRALVETAKRDATRLTAQDLAFALGPRLNAAGRLDDMALGIRCLLADDLAEARSLATALEQLNASRRALEQEMTAQAALLVAGLDLREAPELGICVYDPSWHQGVVGIVAGRLRERFNRPAIAFADASPIGDELKGSARSVAAVHVRDALDNIAARYPGLIQKFGGHAMAAGLTVRRPHLPRFAKAFAAEMTRWIGENDVRGTLLTDGELTETDLELATARLIERFGPWGQQFPEPVFHGVFDLVHQRVVGERHVKLALRFGRRLLDAIAFNCVPLSGSPPRVRAVYRLAENAFNGAATLQLVIEHMEPLESVQTC